MAVAADTAAALTPADRAFFGHPPGLAYMAFMEAFERFSFYGMQAFLLALLLLMLGCGLLKGNVSAQVGNLYQGPDRRRQDAFQLFYMAANVGVFCAPLVCGTLGEKVGWHWGFGAAGVGMLISLAIY